MREIKFRVWNHKESKMIYLDDKEKDVEINFLNNITSNHETYWEVVTKVSDLQFAYMPQYFDSRDNENVLMQYTGLKEENGKEIYEGDILNMTYRDDAKKEEPRNLSITWKEPIKGVVKFENAGFFVGDEFVPLGKIGRSLEVIGNIYEGENK